MKKSCFIALLILFYSLHGKAEDPLIEFLHDSTDTSVEVFEYIEPIDSSITDGYTVKNKPKKSFGALHIITDLDDCSIFLNGKRVGTGSVMIDTISPGEYTVTAEGDDEEETEIVYVVNGHVRSVEIQLKRHVFFSVTHSFSQSWCKGSRSFGPSADLGVQFYRNYLGINFHWNFFDSDRGRPHAGDIYSGEMVGGAAVQYYYDLVNQEDAFILSAGTCAGYWNYWGEIYDPEGYDYDYFDGHFFGGVSLRTSVGYKYVFFNCAYTILFGTAVAHTLTFGIRSNM